MLENGLHYFEDGQWKESEDLIEVFPDGAIARRGPNQAVFSPDLNVPAVFDILSSDGKRLRGGVRAIQLTDLATGRSQVVAAVKELAPGELIPPNRLVYRDAFDGLKADVLLVWKHNYFSQDIVLLEQPRLPEGMNPETTRIEVLTEVVEAPEATIRQQTVRGAAAAELDDDVVIHFGRLAMVMGKAFPVNEGAGWTVGGLDASEESRPVLKQWHPLPDGRTFLIESIGWLDAQPHLNALPVTEEARAIPASREETAVARVWPERPRTRSEARPLQLAQLDYEPKGYVLDFVIIPDDDQPTTFLANETYYIKTSYYTGSSVTFEPNCCVKFKHNSYLLLYGPVNFPASEPKAVFTSRNDSNFGEPIMGVPNEADSDGDPTSHKAAQAIWLYYVDFNTTIQNARIRWAQRGIQYDVNPGVYVTHTLQSSLVEYTDTGVYANLEDAALYLDNVKKCTVTTPIYCPSQSCYGSMTEDCGVVSIARVNDPAQDNASGDPNKNSQSECSFVVVDSSTIVAAFWDTHLSAYSLGAFNFPEITAPRSTGWAVSTDGGVTFTDNGAIPPTVPSSTLEGDVGDPVMARDVQSGTIYLLCNPSRESGTYNGFRLWKSINNGQDFSPAHSNVPSGVTQADKPMIAINNFQNTPNYGHIYVAGTGFISGTPGTFATLSTDGGADWSDPELLSVSGHGAEVVVAPNGTVYIFYLVRTLIDFGPPQVWQITLKYTWRKPADTAWATPVTIAAHPDSQDLYSVNRNGGGNLKRSNSATAEDYFVNNANPRAAVNPVNGRIYMVYADLPFAGSSTDRGD
ncbi:MAG TPA: sialidase family protein, partial [Methylomirabilota bacterium]|nr:sialidase family protein [Methylomirabilota bacterium]